MLAKSQWKIKTMLSGAAVALIFHCSPDLHAQAVQIELVNGKTGRPITDRSLLNVWVGHVRLFPFLLPTDKQGVARVRLSLNDSEINVPECKDEQADWEKLSASPSREAERAFNKKYKYCGSFELPNPVARYANSMRVQTLPGDVSWKTGQHSVPYVPCWIDPKSESASWTNIQDFPTKDVLEKGIVTANNCGTATVSPNPGQLVLFVRPPTIAEQWRQAWN